MSNYKRGYIENRERFMENLRRDRWHATYNAALTGALAYGNVDWEPRSAEQARQVALESANLAHGELDNEEEDMPS